MSLVELFELFPDDTTAEAWFELQRWGKQICCPRCGSVRYSKVKNRRPMPYRCQGRAGTIEDVLAVENDVVPFDRADVLGAGLRPGLPW